MEMIEELIRIMRTRKDPNMKMLPEIRNCFKFRLLTPIRHGEIPIWSWQAKNDVFRLAGLLTEPVLEFEAVNNRRTYSNNGNWKIPKKKWPVVIQYGFKFQLITPNSRREITNRGEHFCGIFLWGSYEDLSRILEGFCYHYIFQSIVQFITVEIASASGNSKYVV